MTFNEFHNALRVLLNIDADEFITTVFEQDYDEFGRHEVAECQHEVAECQHEVAEWRIFRDNPHRWFIATDDDKANRIWTLMQRRTK